MKAHEVPGQPSPLQGEEKGPGSGFGQGVLISAQPAEKLREQCAPPPTPPPAMTLGIVQASEKISRVWHSWLQASSRKPQKDVRRGVLAGNTGSLEAQGAVRAVLLSP